jgi:curved DNA-binding protein CbpA
MTLQDPFRELEIPPTVDAVAIKRAYFTVVARRGPTTDPDGFRRVREAYERLGTAEGRAAAYFAADVDVSSELNALRARFDAALATAAESERAERDALDVVGRFVNETSRRTWESVFRAVR